ncbi:MAG: aspartyl protease family protein [Bacteroidota bacterium]
MRRILISGMLILFLFACKDETINHISLPDGAVPIVYCGYIYIHGSVDSVNGNFLLDTGAENLHLDSIFYIDNNFAYENYQNGKINGIGNSFQEAIAIMDTVNFQYNNHSYESSFVLVHNLKIIGGDFIDGIIGLNFFSKKILEVNFLRQFINVHNSIDSVDISGYSMIPIEIIDDRMCVPLKIKANGKVTVEGNFMIDVGSTLSTMTSSIAEKFNFNENIDRKVAYYTKYGGIGGDSYGYDLIADSIFISDFSLCNVNMSYSIDTSGLMASEDFFGILGNNILERFDVIFDFDNNNLYLKPNAEFISPYVFDRLGFSYVDRSKTMGGWIVTGLSKGSPAEKQGLQIDDKIISVNKISVEKISFKTQNDFFKQLDKVEFIINRSGNLIKIKFKLFPLL